MSLDKAIIHGKEHRKQYEGAKSIDKTCRNHGSCSWCRGNRTWKNNKRELSAKQEIEEYEEEAAKLDVKEKTLKSACPSD